MRTVNIVLAAVTALLWLAYLLVVIASGGAPFDVSWGHGVMALISIIIMPFGAIAFWRKALSDDPTWKL